MKKIRLDVILLLVAMVCFACYGVIAKQNMELENNAKNVKIRLQQLENKDYVSETETKYINPYINLFEANEDMIAWINIPNTNID